MTIFSPQEVESPEESPRSTSARALRIAFLVGLLIFLFTAVTVAVCFLTAYALMKTVALYDSANLWPSTFWGGWFVFLFYLEVQAVVDLVIRANRG